MTNQFQKVSTDIQEFDALIQKAKDLIFQEERLMKAINEGWGGFEARDEDSGSGEENSLNDRKHLFQDIGNREFLDVLKEVVVSASATFPQRYIRFEAASYNYMTTLWNMFSRAVTTDNYKRHIDDLDMRIMYTKDHIAFIKTWIEVNADQKLDDPFNTIVMDTPLFDRLLLAEEKIESMIKEKERWKKEMEASTEEFLSLKRKVDVMMKEFKETYAHE